MLVVKLSSGLGNQLFQYAFFKYLEQNTNQKVVFEDKSFLKNNNYRRSELAVVYPDYPVNNNIPFLNSHLTGLKRRLYHTAFLLDPHNVIIKDDTAYTIPDTYKENKIYYFDGYWQSSNFVASLKNKVTLFTPKEKIPDLLKPVYDAITREKNAVCIHVRRGDYFSSLYIDRYGVCDATYYNESIQYIKDRCADTKYFVFSDNPEWVKENVHLPTNACYVPNYDINSFWYINLMSACKHMIISNSTFSWWGAYLNNYPEKIVVSPSRWRLDIDFQLALPEWVKINVNSRKR